MTRLLAIRARHRALVALERQRAWRWTCTRRFELHSPWFLVGSELEPWLSDHGAPHDPVAVADATASPDAQHRLRAVLDPSVPGWREEWLATHTPDGARRSAGSDVEAVGPARKRLIKRLQRTRAVERRSHDALACYEQFMAGIVARVDARRTQ